uniref:Uncharacterized protein n=1 Tax=Rhizophora mucronata TaxID=61149 RepID=A0A2P2Q1K7_RHIMU
MIGRCECLTCLISYISSFLSSCCVLRFANLEYIKSVKASFF